MLEVGGLKGVAIDGAALWNMQRMLGIAELNYRSFVGCLKKIGNNVPFVQRPRSSIHPKLCKTGVRLYDDMRRAGILPRAATSCNEDDDRLVIKWGSRYICKNNVSDIVLVTCDAEIIDTLLELLEYRQARDKDCPNVHVLGTCLPDTDGACPFCMDLLAELRKNPATTFHDLESIKNAIMSKRVVH